MSWLQTSHDDILDSFSSVLENAAKATILLIPVNDFFALDWHRI